MGTRIPERHTTERPTTRTSRVRYGLRVPVSVAETDGGRVDQNVFPFTTYTDDEHGYSLAYPAEWAVERDSDGGVTFEAPRSTAGAVVFVEENVVEGSELTSEMAAATFLADLADDEHVHALDVLTRRDTQLKNGQTGRAIECAYVADSGKQWRLSYLFVTVESTGYTIGVDWNDAIDFETDATRIVESFAVEETD